MASSPALEEEKREAEIDSKADNSTILEWYISI